MRWKTYKTIRKLKAWFLKFVDVGVTLDLLGFSKGVEWINPFCMVSSANLFLKNFNTKFRLKSQIVNNRTVSISSEVSTKDTQLLEQGNSPLSDEMTIEGSFIGIILQFRAKDDSGGDEFDRSYIYLDWYVDNTLVKTNKYPLLGDGTRHNYNGEFIVCFDFEKTTKIRYSFRKEHNWQYIGSIKRYVLRQFDKGTSLGLVDINAIVFEDKKEGEIF